MPGLMQLRARYKREKPLEGARIAGEINELMIIFRIQLYTDHPFDIPN